MECVKCIGVWLGAVRSEWIRGLGLGCTIPVGTWVVLDVCLCLRWYGWYGWRRWGVVNGLD